MRILNWRRRGPLPPIARRKTGVFDALWRGKVADEVGRMRGIARKRDGFEGRGAGLRDQGFRFLRLSNELSISGD